MASRSASKVRSRKMPQASWLRSPRMGETTRCWITYTGGTADGTGTQYGVVNTARGVAFGSALSLRIIWWLRSPSGSSASVVYVVSVAGAAQVNDPAKAAAKNGVAFGFSGSALCSEQIHRWLRSPWQPYSNYFYGGGEDGSIWPKYTSVAMFSTTSFQGVAFGFRGPALYCT